MLVKDFIYKIDDSNKLDVQTEHDSIDEFFDKPMANDVKLDTLIIYAVDTKEPLIKIEKMNKDNKTNYKFIVDITNSDGDDFIIRAIIKNQSQLKEKIEKTIEALNLYPEFSKYANDLEDCL